MLNSLRFSLFRKCWESRSTKDIHMIKHFLGVGVKICNFRKTFVLIFHKKLHLNPSSTFGVAGCIRKVHFVLYFLCSHYILQHQVKDIF
jgi:hypothetical protein